MDFEKRLEAMELMLELLDQKSSCSDSYHALSTRWSRPAIARVKQKIMPG